jgi:anti-sigma factor RsiW
MSSLDCQRVRDILPDLVGGRLDPDQAQQVQEHLAGCPDCAGELKVVRAVFDARPPVPEGLEARIQGQVRDRFEGHRSAGVEEGQGGERPGTVLPFRRRVPVWALSAAAVVILALGTSRIWNNGSPNGMLDPTEIAAQDPLPEAWLLDDGMIAGAPVFDDLSDDELEALLEEFEG